MKTLIQLEEAALLMGAAFFSNQIGYGPLLFLAFLLVPDVSMIGYLVNPRVGAWLYNLVHHRGIGVVVTMSGYFLQMPMVVFAGLILFGHTAMDRMFGYGLKFEDSFHHTHLGTIGRKGNTQRIK
jgi:hypothetical protein